MEVLETRTLLASAFAQTGGFMEELTWVNQALTGDAGTVLNIEIVGSDTVLIVRGPGSGTLTINTEALPETIGSLLVSSFSEVAFTGDHVFRSLAAIDVGRLDAASITVRTDFSAFNVEQVSLSKMPTIARFEGDETVIRSNDFSNSLIVSGLNTIGISSDLPVPEVNLLSSNPKQNVYIDFQPNTFGVSGLDDAYQIALVRGDLEALVLGPPDQTLAAHTGSAGATITTTPLSNVVELHDWSALQMTLSGLTETSLPIGTDETRAGALNTADRIGALDLGTSSEATSRASRFYSGAGSAGGGVPALGGIDAFVPEMPPAQELDGQGIFVLGLGGSAGPSSWISEAFLGDSRSGLDGDLGADDSSKESAVLRTLKDNISLLANRLEESAESLGDFLLDKVAAQFEAGERAVHLVENRPKGDQDSAA